LKKVLLIFLLLQISSANSFAEELLRLPALLSHYRHHTTEHHDKGNFVDFLYKHYAANDDADDDEHHGLPFKHCGSCCLNAHVTPVCFLSSFNTNFSLYQTRHTCFYTEDERIQSLELNSIWQPPKLG
jgi:hypothetical protein